MTVYRPVTVHLPDGTVSVVPLPERYRGQDMWLTDRNPEDTRLTRPRLDARAQALHAATAWGGIIMAALTGGRPYDMSSSELDGMQWSVLERAAALEAWLMRPVGDEGDEPERAYGRGNT